jgi:ABC-type nitrate/sulfonate/bicarbonate transport system substrate-binding protein
MRLLLASLLALAAAGCGGGSAGDAVDERARLLLDFQPNGAHAGLYLATSRAYDQAEGVTVEILKPGASTNALRSLRAGRADVAILDIHDLGLARERGADLIGFAAVVQRPLAAVLAQPEIRSPKDLEGRRVGVTGLPSDEAVLRTVVRGGGGDPGRVREVTIGFEATRALLAGRVAAATAFWNVEGVALRARRPEIREFRVEDFGAPAYPELVLVTTPRQLDEQRDGLDALVRAMRRGYEEAQRDPESAAGAMVDAERGLDRDTVLREIDAIAPAWTAGAVAWGQLRPDVLRAWARWDVRTGILRRAPDIDAAFELDVGVPR